MVKFSKLIENKEKEEAHVSFEFAEGFKPAKKVPKGGAMCANCAKWNDEKKVCEGPYYIKWHGNGEIPASATEYVCVWWVPEKHK
jgi:hypothetical protein